MGETLRAGLFGLGILTARWPVSSACSLRAYGIQLVKVQFDFVQRHAESQRQTDGLHTRFGRVGLVQYGSCNLICH